MSDRSAALLHAAATIYAGDSRRNENHAVEMAYALLDLIQEREKPVTRDKECGLCGGVNTHDDLCARGNRV